MAAWAGIPSAVVLAFSGTNQTLENVTASNPLQSINFFNAAFGDNGTIDAEIFDPFSEVLAPASLSSVSHLIN